MTAPLTEAELATLVADIRAALEAVGNVKLSYKYRTAPARGHKGSWEEFSGRVDVINTSGLPQSQVAVIVKDEDGDEATAAVPQKEMEYADCKYEVMSAQKTTKRQKKQAGTRQPTPPPQAVAIASPTQPLTYSYFPRH